MSSRQDLRQDGGSFRDPAGQVFYKNGVVYRLVTDTGKADYDYLKSSGLYDELVNANLLIPHSEVKSLKELTERPHTYKILKPDTVPFISYPYEWTFSQLQQAALLTLDVLAQSFKHGMILKDASAYNVQFIGDKPVFIDTLSFEIYEKGKPWQGYKQFCEHFLAPLALAHYSSMDVLKTLRTHIDGMPLSYVINLIPAKARLRPGLLAHLYLHNASQQRHNRGGQDVANKAAARTMKPLAMQGLFASLEAAVTKLRSPTAQTEWGNYYEFTNYSDNAFKTKRSIVKDMIKQVSPAPRVVWDIGANNGEFSEVSAEAGIYTVSFDIDTVAVARNVRAKRAAHIKSHILPLVQDMTNPSPALGWGHQERMSLAQRGKADIVLALAVIHHLSIGNNVPFDKVASYLHEVGSSVIIEFVPKGDSKVDHLLASRKDIFTDYDAEHFEKAMGVYFKLVSKKLVKGSKRSIYLYKAK